VVKLGVIITAATAAIFVLEFLRHRTRALPEYGWLGIATLVVAEAMKFRGVEIIAIYFTPIAWSCYILIADAAVFAINGRSRLQHAPGEFGKVALLSIPLWLVFEAYNLRLENWTYVGLPENIFARWFGYAWAFATITPAIFLTADLVQAFGWFDAGADTSGRRAKRLRISARMENAMIIAGALLVTVPVVLPKHIGAYLFGMVWLGFIFLLDPVNARLKLPSLVGDAAQGRYARLGALLVSGWTCGWLWEFWNNWAAAKWLYIFPILQDWKIFEMPAPGFLGFPPFALECFTMYVTASWLLRKAARHNAGGQAGH
jgi:hypothetical protein